jgi:putative DNA primase/helicase
VLHGSGSNGKSTFLDTVRHVLGGYVVHTRAETFVVKEGSSGVPNDVAALRGARVVTASEIKQGARLDESLIKEMTGDSAMTARFMRAEFFTFEPTWKVLWALNHRPVIRGTDMGIWRRMRLIPFEVSIPDEEKDRDLGNKLKLEQDGILAWMIAGCEMWQQVGLAPPERVMEATRAYRDDMDVLKDFLEERCDLGPGLGVSNTDLYSAFQAWATANGERERSQRWFSQALHDRGYRQDPSRRAGRRWMGVDLKRLAPTTTYSDRGAWS